MPMCLQRRCQAHGHRAGSVARHLGRVLMEHRAGLMVKTAVTPADGHGERDAALVQRAGVAGRHWITVAADKGYDTRGLTARFPVMHATPHLAQHATGRRSANR